jgi:hypothetical protein
LPGPVYGPYGGTGGALFEDFYNSGFPNRGTAVLAEINVGIDGNLFLRGIGRRYIRVQDNLTFARYNGGPVDSPRVFELRLDQGECITKVVVGLGSYTGADDVGAVVSLSLHTSLNRRSQIFRASGGEVETVVVPPPGDPPGCLLALRGRAGADLDALGFYFGPFTGEPQVPMGMGSTSIDEWVIGGSVAVS